VFYFGEHIAVHQQLFLVGTIGRFWGTSARS
jgi:hypothetical protein